MSCFALLPYGCLVLELWCLVLLVKGAMRRAHAAQTMEIVLYDSQS